MPCVLTGVDKGQLALCLEKQMHRQDTEHSSVIIGSVVEVIHVRYGVYM